MIHHLKKIMLGNEPDLLDGLARLGTKPALASRSWGKPGFDVGTLIHSACSARSVRRGGCRPGMRCMGRIAARGVLTLMLPYDTNGPCALGIAYPNPPAIRMPPLTPTQH